MRSLLPTAHAASRYDKLILACDGLEAFACSCGVHTHVQGPCSPVAHMVSSTFCACPALQFVCGLACPLIIELGTKKASVQFGLPILIFAACFAACAIIIGLRKVKGEVKVSLHWLGCNLYAKVLMQLTALLHFDDIVVTKASTRRQQRKNPEAMATGAIQPYARVRWLYAAFMLACKLILGSGLGDKLTQHLSIPWFYLQSYFVCARSLPLLVVSCTLLAQGVCIQEENGNKPLASGPVGLLCFLVPSHPHTACAPGAGSK